ncbi:MAG: carboxypeptidase-like regulatory domain-containing protein [Planctomycetaceae bacterium]|nr:carboxypeptidase-like regulatory domain-containing protein [Planctomycetaceae bacterium]
MLVFVIFTGCSHKGKLRGLVPCCGTVTLDGTVVADAQVLFLPVQESLRVASGKTNAQGQFVLSSLTTNDGIMPGEYCVTIIRIEKTGTVRKPVINEFGESVMPPPETRNVLPERYADKTTSDIKVTVPASGDKNIKIELSQ